MMKIHEIYFPTLESTNDWAKSHLIEMDQGLITLVRADHQSAGRGRFNHTWFSPQGLNLYLSFCFFLSQEENPLSLTHLLALSVIKTLNRSDISGKIKWPNDVLVDGKKIGGILCETHPIQEKVGVVLGLGLNVNLDKEDLKYISQAATSIFLETGEKKELDIILRELKTIFCRDLELYRQRGFAPFIPEYQNAIYTP